MSSGANERRGCRAECLIETWRHATQCRRAAHVAKFNLVNALTTGTSMRVFPVIILTLALAVPLAISVGFSRQLVRGASRHDG